MTVSKTGFVVAAALSIAAISQAGHARPGTQSYTCEGVRDLIAQRGAIVMNTTSSHVYRRFVANRSFCSYGERTKRYSVPTRSGRCSLRICVEFDNDDDLFRRGGRN